MAVRISTAARNAAADAIAALADGGSGAGVIRIYTGSQPAGPGSAATGTLLATVTLNDPAFAAASSAEAALDVDPVPSGTAVASGTAGWFRLLDSTEAGSTGLGILDGSVTATGGDGDLTLATVTITTGLTVEITGGELTMPAEPAGA
ncbi:hypothetical protein ACFHW1_04970 [Micromonospora sp. LOL_014]|uniref:hypothetical protein n=1 Tax=Micromonospora sp. LOL_014 TaxID=3345415 RepID=UPI003A8C2156